MKEYLSLLHGNLKKQFIENLSRDFTKTSPEDNQESLRKKILKEIKEGRLR